jgi:TRAP-type uncharacterized transport system fused permease subunit
MIQLLFCLFLLVPIVALPVVMLMVSPVLAIIAAVAASILAIPLLIAAYAHFDLLRVRARFGLNDEELDEFCRLVPRLATKPEFAGLRRRELQRSTKQAAAEIIRQRREQLSATAPNARRRRRRKPATG